MQAHGTNQDWCGPQTFCADDILTIRPAASSWLVLIAFRESPMNPGGVSTTLTTSTVQRLSISSSAFVHLPPFADFAGAMTLEMTLDAKDFPRFVVRQCRSAPELSARWPVSFEIPPTVDPMGALTERSGAESANKPDLHDLS
jgi:hypothetical protein